MVFPPITWAVEMSTSMSASEARIAVARAILGIKGARAGAPGWLQYRLGSAIWLRMWGIWTPKAHQHLPLVVDGTVTDFGDERRVRLEFRSDEGWYLMRVDSLIKPPYYRRFHEVAEAVGDQLRTS